MASPYSWRIDPDKEPDHYDHWPKHPEWRGRYDFLVASPPVLAATYKTSAVTYRGSLLPLARYHFEAFHWGQDRSQTTTRADVESALHNVLALFDILADACVRHCLIRTISWCDYPDEAFKQEFDNVLTEIMDYLHVVHAIAVHVSTEVHALTDLENKRVVPQTWALYSRNVTLSPELLDKANAPSPNRPADDYVFRLCNLFAVRPAFSDALVDVLAKARSQCDVVSTWAMERGEITQHLGDYYVGYKQRRSKCIEIALPHSGKNVLQYLNTPIAHEEVTRYWPFAEQPVGTPETEGGQTGA